MMRMKPEDLFRAEKERAVTSRNSQHARLLAEAKAAFDKLMAEGQAARKSGRPRKHPLPPLKTASSRLPLKPPFPIAASVEVKAVPLPKLVPLPPPVPVPAPVVLVKARAVAKPVARRAAPAKKAAKAKSKTAPRARRAAAKSKHKAKRSKRR